ncbi:unnamed protein product [Enterobius vermicularis]|uniref:Uncharacterized protein n=1 Tax=Enterobius vermicularis TaxID=51028 RepID=A0A0N4UYH0_ENTVE|nr:unnamed protein product [Enterobius vermicularis]
MIFILWTVIVLGHFLTFISAQDVLFPHGYFDMRNLKAKDAIYLHLLALSSIEYGGITEEELQKEIEETGLFPKGFLKTTTTQIPQLFSEIPSIHSSTTGSDFGFIEQETVVTTPKTPFRRLRDGKFCFRFCSFICCSDNGLFFTIKTQLLFPSPFSLKSLVLFSHKAEI